MDIAGVKLSIVYTTGPQGVRELNSDNTCLHEVLDWSPEVSLEEGLKYTYSWIERKVKQKYQP
jgi:nucleoside-diphosphate-sugar epimerase